MIYISDIFINKQKQKGRILRKTTWWKRKCAHGRCYYCSKGVYPNELTMDHVIPISRGGMSEKSNVVPACKECNNKKKYSLPHEWTQYMESLQEMCL